MKQTLQRASIALVSCTFLACSPPDRDTSSAALPGEPAAGVPSAGASSGSPLDLPCIDCPDPNKAGGASAVKWKNGKTLTVKFVDNPYPSQQLRQRVMATASQWSSHANLYFREVPPSGRADIRITFRGVGHWSRIGNYSKEDQDLASMSLSLNERSPRGDFDRVVLHEFGHAIGLEHEHQLPSAQSIKWNEKEVFAYYAQPPNNWKPEQTRRNVLNHYNARQLRGNYTAFDPKSIMCYPIPKGLANIQVGWNRKLSPTDIQFIRQWYPK